MATVEVIQTEPTYVLTLNEEEAGFIKWVLGCLHDGSGPVGLYGSMRNVPQTMPKTNPFTFVDTQDWDNQL